jgi:hypothetical protein
MWTFFKMATNAIACFVWRLGPRLLSLAFVICLAFLLVFAVLDTRRDVAYRNSTPDDPKCATWGLSGNAVDSSKDNSTILTKSNYNNDEQSAVTDDPALAPVFHLHAATSCDERGFCSL